MELDQKIQDNWIFWWNIDHAINAGKSRMKTHVISGYIYMLRLESASHRKVNETVHLGADLQILN